MASSAPPGWYPDPEVPRGQRYWDGTRWGAQRAPAPLPAPPAIRPVSELRYREQKFFSELHWRLPAAAVAAVALLLVSVFGDRPLFTLGFGPELRAATRTISVADSGCVQRWNSSRTLSTYRALLAQRGTVRISVRTFGVGRPGERFPPGTCGVAVSDDGYRVLGVFAAAGTGDYVDITHDRWAQMVPLRSRADVNAAMHPDGTIESVTPVSG